MTTVLPPGTPVVYDADTGLPEPMADALGDWFTCPDWCDGCCYGGFTWGGIVVARTHTLHRHVAPGIKVVDEQGEDPDLGYGPRRTVLYANRQAFEISPALGDALAAALTAT